jgi:hypothetical protein
MCPKSPIANLTMTHFEQLEDAEAEKLVGGNHQGHRLEQWQRLADRYINHKSGCTTEFWTNGTLSVSIWSFIL